jgi:transcriptional regulator with GAF, ATPase, and Fis domain
MRRDQDAQLIGSSQEMRELQEEIANVSASDAKVLVTGESGVGKELVARAIHAGSPRAHATFVAMNCAGLPETLLESELFGHVKGSFTGAYRDKAGKLELADRGTVFLDEVGEMTLRMQGLLLRFLETGELQKVGSDRPSGRVNVRVIAATNRDLHTLIEEGKFREDLFYRLNVIHLHVPALRERRPDIPALVEHFLLRFAKHRANGAASMRAGNGHSQATGYAPVNGHAVPAAYPAHRGGASAAVLATPDRDTLQFVGINELVTHRVSPEAMAALVEYPWPGNVRELENAIERIVIRARGDVVTLDDLPLEIRAQRGVSLRPKRERRRTVADDLYKKLREDQESFWTAVYPLYMSREITKENVRELVRKGLEEARGNYRIVARLFNMDSGDYKKFLNFLRKHDCQLPFKEYRQ